MRRIARTSRSIWIEIGDHADDAALGGDAGAVEMVLDVLAHQVGLLDHVAGERLIGCAPVDEHGERRLQRVGDCRYVVRARPSPQGDSGLDQRVEFVGESNFGRHVVVEAVGVTGAIRASARRILL